MKQELIRLLLAVSFLGLLGLTMCNSVQLYKIQNRLKEVTIKDSVRIDTGDGAIYTPPIMLP